MLYFLVYDDNTHNCHLEKLLQSVKIYGEEFNIIVFKKNDIDNDFIEKNKSILNCTRGGGYWLWKPYIINETLKKIVGYEYEENVLPEEYLQCKEYLINEFKNNGSYSKNRYTGDVTSDSRHVYLFDKELLVPIKEILSTDRWGYNRRGINSLSRPLDFDLSVSTEEYKDIKNFNIVFFICQDIG